MRRYTGGMPATSRARFGDLERAVLEVLWAHPDQAMTVREVCVLVSQHREVAYTTAMTVLDRMAKKGLLDQERSGRAYTYRARSSRAEMTAELMRGTLEEMAADDRSSALVAFVDGASTDEIATLRAALAALEANDA